MTTSMQIPYAVPDAAFGGGNVQACAGGSLDGHRVATTQLDTGKPERPNR